MRPSSQASESSGVLSSMDEHRGAWQALLEGLESLPVFGGVSHRLRGLAASAECVESLLELAASSQASLSELPELRGALESLEEQQETVLDLLDLVELADAVDELSYLTRRVQRYRDELAWRIDEAEESVTEDRA